MNNLDAFQHLSASRSRSIGCSVSNANRLSISTPQTKAALLKMLLFLPLNLSIPSRESGRILMLFIEKMAVRLKRRRVWEDCKGIGQIMVLGGIVNWSKSGSGRCALLLPNTNLIFSWIIVKLIFLLSQKITLLHRKNGIRAKEKTVWIYDDWPVDGCGWASKL